MITSPKEGGKTRGGKIVEIEDLARIRYAYKGDPCVCHENPKDLWDVEKLYREAFGPEDGMWTPADFDECIMILALHFAIDNQIKVMRKKAKKRTDAENAKIRAAFEKSPKRGEPVLKEPERYLHLKRLRYHMLGLARMWVEDLGLSANKLLAKKDVFDEHFKKFWVSQLPSADMMKSLAMERGTKGFYNVVRNHADWERMQQNYRAVLDSLAE